MLATDIPELVFSNPALAIALTALVLLAVNYQRGLTYSEFRLLHAVKCRVFGLVDPWARKRGRPLVRVADEVDHVRTIDANARTVAKGIADVFSAHLVATAKRRVIDDAHPAAGRTQYQWSHSQWVQFHGDGTQTEVYIFSNSDGTTDVYAHVETSVTDPEGHLEDAQRHGDARGAFASAWDPSDAE